MSLFLLLLSSVPPAHNILPLDLVNSYRVDPYYRSPSRCSQCCQWGHTQRLRRGSLTCSGCGREGHSSSDCTSQSLSCPNCGGPHSALSRQCPQSIKEHHICQIKAKNNISYPEARKIFLSFQTSTSLQIIYPLFLLSMPQLYLCLLLNTLPCDLLALLLSLLSHLPLRLLPLLGSLFSSQGLRTPLPRTPPFCPKWALFLLSKLSLAAQPLPITPRLTSHLPLSSVALLLYMDT